MPTRRGDHRAAKANLPRRREGKKKTHAEARRRRGKRGNPATPETTEYHSISRRKSVQEHPRERFILCKASIPGVAVSASMRCTCRRSISASRARASWINFRFLSNAANIPSKSDSGTTITPGHGAVRRANGERSDGRFILLDAFFGRSNNNSRVMKLLLFPFASASS